MKFTYAGPVLSDAGGGLFYVGARGTWYPNRGMAMADYDLTFRFPAAVFADGHRQEGFAGARRRHLGWPLGQREADSHRRLQSRGVRTAPRNAANIERRGLRRRGSENQIAPSGSAQVSPAEDIAAGQPRRPRRRQRPSPIRKGRARTGRPRRADSDLASATAGAVSVRHAVAHRASRRRQPGLAEAHLPLELCLPRRRALCG